MLTPYLNKARVVSALQQAVVLGVVALVLSLLAWYVFAPQCLSTLSVVKRETGGWRYPLLMAVVVAALPYSQRRTGKTGLSPS